MAFLKGRTFLRGHIVCLNILKGLACRSFILLTATTRRHRIFLSLKSEFLEFFKEFGLCLLKLPDSLIFLGFLALLGFYPSLEAVYWVANLKLHLPFGARLCFVHLQLKVDDLWRKRLAAVSLRRSRAEVLRIAPRTFEARV